MNVFTEYRHSKLILGCHWDVVFFAEKGSDYPYLSHALDALLPQYDKVCYITADKNDPLLQQHSGLLQVFYSFNLLGHVLNHLKADHVLMTMPDLQQFLFKRSPGVKEYIYIFHALVSTHQQYRPGAFDHYDTILCAGPHHAAEIRLRESQQHLPAKRLIPYGYPLLDNWPERQNPSKPTILLAPTWYEAGIFETCLEPVIEELKKTGAAISIRFHPEFIKRNKKKYQAIVKQVSGEPQLAIDSEPDVRKSLAAADLLITDRSGIAFEFALGAGRPVIFIDTPPKQFNPEAQTLGVPPAEDAYRSRIGTCLKPGELNTLSGVALRLLKNNITDASLTRNELVYDTMKELRLDH